ncbi:MAG: hypothetical protein KBD76_03810 [Bacteriovorax sp.]|nr:hypothetical protein [Bacteriovorax sp.]
MKCATPFKTLLLLILSSVLFLVACVPATGTRGKLGSKSNGLTGKGASVRGPAAVGSDPVSVDATLTTQRVELSHLVDPFDGTYKKKLTLPKNFKGNLYLAGLNVSALTNKIVFVRFNFGFDKQSVTLNTTIGRAPGIVPKTDIQVLMVDMNSRPFNKMRLPYDLYDYNDYVADTSKEIVTDPRDGGLYCRGLKLEDDPTFIPLNNTSTCSGTEDRCLYSYAKVVDSTLYSDQVVNTLTYRLSSIPTIPQVWTESAGVRTPSLSTLAQNSCLPDDYNASSVNELFNLAPALALDYDELIEGYYYRGPYRSIDDSNWQISSSAIYNTKSGLFQTPSSLVGMTTGYHSLLFPRAGKLALSQGVNYLGSSTVKIGPRVKSTTNSTGTTDYVDGCNYRVMNYDSAANEGIGSCNVGSSIEIFYMLDGKEVNITTDRSIKLQLIRPSLTNYEGKEVLNTSFKRCESSTTCGSNECCFNSRCWSKDLVTQCVDQTPVVGNQEIGANCTSDFECSSLCCNQSTGSCSPHNPNGGSAISCGKSAGQLCVTREFCAKEPVVTCKIVKTGLKADGTAACALRCPAVMTYGDCKAGACVPPTQPAIPDINDPQACANAVDP